MRNYIILNGKNSNTIQGLLIQSLAPITKTMIRTQVEEIDGRDGDIVTPLGFSAYDKTISIGLYGNYDINEIIEYFNSNGIVTFSNEPDKYYNYQINAQIDFERLIRFKTATVTMHCQPFKYSTTEQPEILSPTDELLTIPDWQQIENGVTVSCTNGVISVSGTPTSATEFYLPITALALQAGSYTLTASANGQNPNNCSIRMIGAAPSDADSFGNRYISLVQGTTSLSATLAASKTFNYIWFYMSAGVTVGFTLTLSVAESAKATSGEGTNIVLENTAEAPFRRFDLKGNTEQTTYSGKNLLKLTQRDSASNGITATISNGVITVSGTPTTTWANIVASTTNAISAGTYTLSIEEPFSTNIAYALHVTYSDNTGEDITVWKAVGKDKVVTFSKDVKSYFMFLTGLSTSTNYSFKMKPMLELGSVATDFEPYVGGMPSPNPEYPQNVQIVKGDNTIKISNKNLLKLTQRAEPSNGITATVSSDGSISYSGTAVTNWANLTGLENIELPAGTYTLSIAKPLPSNYAYGLIVYYEDGTQADFEVWKVTSNWDNITFTKKTKFMYLFLTGLTAGNNYSGEIKPMLEQGSNFTSFVPHQEQTYLVSLGIDELLEKDSIYKNGNKWYKLKEIGKVSIDSTGLANFNNHGGNHITVSYSVPSSKIVAENKVTTKSESFIGASIANVWQGVVINGVSQASNGNYLLFSLPASTGASLDEIKAYFANHPTTVYYELANPVETEITDETLKAQLEAIAQANSYRGRTHINASAATGNVPHIISAEALANADGTIRNSGNIYSKPKLTIFGSGDIAVYLNNVQMFQIALGDNQYITIDTAALEAYKDTTENLMNRLVTGDYQNFAFQVGDNTLTFSGTVTECVVENYSRWL